MTLLAQVREETLNMIMPNVMSIISFRWLRALAWISESGDLQVMDSSRSPLALKNLDPLYKRHALSR